MVLTLVLLQRKPFYFISLYLSDITLPIQCYTHLPVCHVLFSVHVTCDIATYMLSIDMLMLVLSDINLTSVYDINAFIDVCIYVCEIEINMEKNKNKRAKMALYRLPEYRTNT